MGEASEHREERCEFIEGREARRHSRHLHHSSQTVKIIEKLFLKRCSPIDGLGQMVDGIEPPFTCQLEGLSIHSYRAAKSYCERFVAVRCSKGITHSFNVSN